MCQLHIKTPIIFIHKKVIHSVQSVDALIFLLFLVERICLPFHRLFYKIIVIRPVSVVAQNIKLACDLSPDYCARICPRHSQRPTFVNYLKFSGVNSN